MNVDGAINYVTLSWRSSRLSYYWRGSSFSTAFLQAFL